jgi:hypothetical protein
MLANLNEEGSDLGSDKKSTFCFKPTLWQVNRTHFNGTEQNK